MPTAQNLRRHSLSGCCIFRVGTMSEHLLKLCIQVLWFVSSTWGPDKKKAMWDSRNLFFGFSNQDLFIMTCSHLRATFSTYFHLPCRAVFPCLGTFLCISAPLSSFTPFLLKCLIPSLFSWLYCFTKAKDRCVSSSRLVTLLYLLVINYTLSHGKPIAGVKERI